MFKKFFVVTLIFFVCAGAFAKTGYVTSKSLNIYAKPDRSSDIQGLLGRGSQVTILGSRSGWYKIKLLEGGTGYVKAASVSSKVVKPDKAADSGKNKNDKKADNKKTDKQADKKVVEKPDGSAAGVIKNMLDKFSKTVLQSDFADARKIVPSMSLAEKKSDSDLVFLYSAVDTSGKKVPSLLKNPLAKNMRELIELSFLRMLKYKADEYTITVDTPYFGMGGKINGSVHYAVFKIKATPDDIQLLEHGRISVWTLIKSSRKLGDVFASYPH